MSVLVLGRAFFLEAARSRLFLVAALVSLIIVGVSFLIGPISLGTGDKITRDMGLASLLVCASFMIFTGATHLIGKELERKTAYLFLSRPIHRAEYVLGKFVGVVMTSWAMLLLSGAVFALALLLRGDRIDAPILQAAALTGGELVVLSAAVVLFTSIATPVPSMLYAFGLFVAGHTMAGIFEMSADAMTGLSSTLLGVLKWVTPDLARFDMRLAAVHGSGIEATDLLFALGYAAVYACGLLALACAAFARKELK